MNGNDNAFPKITYINLDLSHTNFGNVSSENGLTKRELFAAMAMQGWLANFSDGHVQQIITMARTGEKKTHAQICAEESVACADALIDELSKGKK